MRFYNFLGNSTLVLYTLMVLWFTSFSYMHTSSVIASEIDTSISPISGICTLAQTIKSSETAPTVDKQFAIQILDACEIDSRRLTLAWDIHTITEDLFRIQDPLLFEAVLYILPRDHSEKWDFIHILEQHQNDILKRLESSQTKMSHFLQTRFFLERFTISWGESNKKELIKNIQWWKDHTDIHLPYIDAWSYFIFGTVLEPHLTFEQVMKPQDIFINWSSMKYLWNRKQALMAVRENTPWILIEALANIRTIQSNAWDSPFARFLSADFVEAFSLHPELLTTIYFDPIYISFVDDLIKLKTWLKDVALGYDPEKSLAIIDRLITLIESQQLGPWDKISKQWYSWGNPLHPIIDALMTLSISNNDRISKLISQHQSFFSQSENVKYRDQILVLLQETKKHTLTGEIQSSTGVHPTISREITADEHNQRNTNTTDISQNQRILYGLYGCIFLLSIVMLMFFIRKHP